MLKELTATDWRHIVETVEAQREGIEPGDTEAPEEVVMTSIGYVAVGCGLDAGSGYVQREGSFLTEDEWPEIISGDQAVARCSWNEETRLGLLEEFIASTGAQEECEAFLARRAAGELADGGENVVVDLEGDV